MQHVIDGVRRGEELHFLFEQSIEEAIGTPSGKMITDSDAMTFVYLLESEKGYNPIHFPQPVWPSMVEVLEKELRAFIIVNNEPIELTQFSEELTMLIYNIEGNGNYGEVFSTEVEKSFQSILQFEN